MKFYIFTEASKQIGFGHLVRCCALYDAIVRYGHEAELVVYGEALENVLENRMFKYRYWQNINTIEEIDLYNAVCIVDSYITELEVYEYIDKNAILLVSIDDYWRLQYPGGIVVKPSIIDFAKENVNPEVLVLSGSEYLILRQNFSETDEKKINEKLKKVLVILGGTDIRNLSPQICHFLMRKGNVETKYIIAGSEEKKQFIERFVDDSFVVYSHVGSLEISELMGLADVSITGAGQTLYELLCLGTPFIPIEIIDNQRDNIRGLLENDLVDSIIKWDSETFESELEIAFSRMESAVYRRSLSKRYQHCVDGRGAYRIVERILEVLNEKK